MSYVKEYCKSWCQYCTLLSRRGDAVNCGWWPRGLVSAVFAEDIQEDCQPHGTCLSGRERSHAHTRTAITALSSSMSCSPAFLWLMLQVAILSGGDDNLCQSAFQYGKNVGLAFQVSLYCLVTTLSFEVDFCSWSKGLLLSALHESVLMLGIEDGLSCTETTVIWELFMFQNISWLKLSCQFSFGII